VEGTRHRGDRRSKQESVHPSPCCSVQCIRARVAVFSASEPVLQCSYVQQKSFFFNFVDETASSIVPSKSLALELEVETEMITIGHNNKPVQFNPNYHSLRLF
jgi:hypothetical protein